MFVKKIIMSVFTLSLLGMSLVPVSANSVVEDNSTPVIESVNENEIMPRTSYDWHTNPNGTQDAIVETNPYQEVKIVGPWNGGFSVPNAVGIKATKWTISWNGSHYSNKFKINIYNGNTGELIDSVRVSGQAGETTLILPVQKLTSQGINIYIENLTNEWQAFWDIRVRSSI